MDDVEQSVIEYFRSRAVGRSAAGALDSSFRLMESGLLDSMEIMSLVTHLEQAYGFALPDDEFVPENFETPGTIAQMVRRVIATRQK